MGTWPAAISMGDCREPVLPWFLGDFREPVLPWSMVAISQFRNRKRIFSYHGSGFAPLGANEESR